VSVNSSTKIGGIQVDIRKSIDKRTTKANRPTEVRRSINPKTIAPDFTSKADRRMCRKMLVDSACPSSAALPSPPPSWACTGCQLGTITTETNKTKTLNKAKTAQRVCQAPEDNPMVGVLKKNCEW